MNRKPLGFTLLEVLIAISIFAISISIVYGLYSSIISVVQNVEDITGLNGRVQTTFTRLSRDMKGLYRGELGYLHGQDSTTSFEEDPLLEFMSRAHLSFNPDAAPVPLSVIRYYLTPDEQDETYFLLRSDTPVRIGMDVEELTSENFQEASKLIVCKGLMEVRVTYMDREGNDKNVWDTREGPEEEQKDDNRFPAWVKLELVFPHGENVEEEGAIYATAVLLRPGMIEFSRDNGG